MSNILQSFFKVVGKDGQEVELTEQEARDLLLQLKMLFGDRSYPYTPQPIYIEKYPRDDWWRPIITWGGTSSDNGYTPGTIITTGSTNE